MEVTAYTSDVVAVPLLVMAMAGRFPLPLVAYPLRPAAPVVLQL